MFTQKKINIRLNIKCDWHETTEIHIKHNNLRQNLQKHNHKDTEPPLKESLDASESRGSQLRFALHQCFITVRFQLIHL